MTTILMYEMKKDSYEKAHIINFMFWIVSLLFSY